MMVSALALVAVAACGRGSMVQAHDERMATEPSDRLQMIDLVARFADAANRHDWEAMASLFDEDATWETAAGGLGFRHEGRLAIRRFLVENPNGVDVLFYTASPPVIELTAADRARTRTNITEILRVRASGETKRLFGTYTDDLVKRGGRWLFAHRSFVLQGSFDEPRVAR
jgi:SnoaL-like domain